MNIKEILKQLKTNKVTTGTGIGVGIVTIAVIILKSFDIDLGQISGMSTESVVVNIGALISAIINLWATDKKESNLKTDKDEKSS